MPEIAAAHAGRASPQKAQEGCRGVKSSRRASDRHGCLSRRQRSWPCARGIESGVCGFLSRRKSFLPGAKKAGERGAMDSCRVVASKIRRASRRHSCLSRRQGAREKERKRERERERRLRLIFGVKIASRGGKDSGHAATRRDARKPSSQNSRRASDRHGCLSRRQRSWPCARGIESGVCGFLSRRKSFLPGAKKAGERGAMDSCRVAASKILAEFLAAATRTPAVRLHDWRAVRSRRQGILHVQRRLPALRGQLDVRGRPGMPD